MLMDDNIQTYLIPNNFIDETRVFNGMLRIRNLIEAIIMLIMIAGPCILFIPKTVTAKFGITLACSLPLTMLALMGVNDDSLTTFIKSAISWRKNRQVMLYNDNARTFNARPVDVMLSEVYVSDVLMNSVEKWRAQRSQRDAMVELVENVDFVFKEDDEYVKMTPQEERTRLRQQKKEAKKRKGKKTTSSLPAPKSETHTVDEPQTALIKPEYIETVESVPNAETTEVILKKTNKEDLSKKENPPKVDVSIKEKCIKEDGEVFANEDAESIQFEEMDEGSETFVFDDADEISGELPEDEIIGFEENNETLSFEIESDSNASRNKRRRKRNRRKSQSGGVTNA